MKYMEPLSLSPRYARREHYSIYFKEFLKKNPGNYRGLYAVIENLLKDGWYDEALPYIEQMRTVAGTHQYYVYMGDVMLGKGDLEKAISWWNAGVEHFPDRWQAYCDRADRFKKLGRYEEALADQNAKRKISVREGESLLPQIILETARPVLGPVP